MKTIHDVIHGSIKLNEWQLEIIDTPTFQRLRRIKQLGFAHLVYPGANHTRFEHSLGAMHVASKITNNEEIVAAALIHDIGHTPFSHSTENTLKKYLKSRHEDIKDIIKNSEIKDVLEKYGMNWKLVVKNVTKPPVSGVIDVDRIDYLLRDSHYTGVAYGIIDADRLLDKIVFDGREIYIERGGIRAAESFLISRYLMYSTVYYHHVCRISKKMFERALDYMIRDGLLLAEDLRKMDDYDITCLMRGSEGFPKEIITRLDNRDLYKRALYVPIDHVGVNINRIKIEKTEREIAETAGVDPQEVIVDIPPIEVEDFDIPVEIDGEKISIGEVSPLVESLKEAHLKSVTLGVYTPQENVERVRKAASDYFKVRLLRQKKLEEF
uniref:HD domain-containing protein n=1 Tax=Geoglobus ahangari TaxID=113653 RepID=A0A7C3YM10_9EURY